MNKSHLNTFEEYLIRKGLRLTDQRQFVATAFFSEKGHISAEDLYRKVQKKLPTIGFTTVYRTLKLLSEAGLASGKSFGTPSALFESTTQSGHHDHLICTQCGRIVEFVNDRIEELQATVAAKYGFSVSEHNLEIYGICKDCGWK